MSTTTGSHIPPNNSVSESTGGTSSRPTSHNFTGTIPISRAQSLAILNTLSVGGTVSGHSVAEHHGSSIGGGGGGGGDKGGDIDLQDLHLSEYDPKVRPWAAYVYTHCQPRITLTSHEELHTIYHRSYEEIKWYLLFIDLIFVSVVYNTEHFISKCGSKDIIVYVLAISMFSCVFLARHALDVYASTFIQVKHGLLPLLQNDLAHQIMIVLYGFGILSMAINIDAQPIEHNPDEPDHDGLKYFGQCELRFQFCCSFAIGFILCKVITIVWNALLIYVAGDQTRGGDLHVISTEYRYALFSRINVAICACLLILPTVTEPYYQYAIYLFPIIGLGQFFDDALRKFSFFHQFYQIKTFLSKMFQKEVFTTHPMKVKPRLNFQIRVKERIEEKARRLLQANTHGSGVSNRMISASTSSSGMDHPEVFHDFATLVERLGLVFVLVLGEAIIGLSFANYSDEHSNSGRLTEFSSYLLIASYAVQFFETLDVTTPDLHSLRGGVYLATFFYFLNVLASFDLLVAIAGLLSLYERISEPDATDDALSSSTTEELSSVNEASWQMAFGLFFTQVILVIMRFSHKLHLRRSIRRGLTVSQKCKILYQLNFRNRLSRYEILTLISFSISALLHLLMYPTCRHIECAPEGIITTHALIAATFSALYLVIQAIDQRQKETEYVEFQDRRRKIIREVISAATDMEEQQRNTLLLTVDDVNLDNMDVEMEVRPSARGSRAV